MNLVDDAHQFEVLGRLDDEADRASKTWTSPSDIDRHLLMQRVSRCLSRDLQLCRIRALGVIIPDLDNIFAAEQESLPTRCDRSMTSLAPRPAGWGRHSRA